MSNLQPGNGPANKGNGGKTCLTIFGGGCLSIFLLFSLISAPFTGAGGILPAVIVVGIVIAIVVSRRKAKNSSDFVASKKTPDYSVADYSSSISADESTPPAKSKYLADPPMPTYAQEVQEVESEAQGDFIIAPACQHRFVARELQDKKTINCVCGRNYSTEDLLEYKRLIDVLEHTNARLQKVRYRLATVELPGVAEARNAAAQTQKPVAQKPKAPKAKVNLSLQQWLIIGASVLVLVAGSVFVSTNINTMPQWQFELITIGVALTTGFGAFKARGISVLLTNFLAAFSSSMQLATLSIIGDQISPDFIWSNAPAWWWAIELTVLSVLATVLAKYSKNFGWKGIALLSSTGAALVTDLGLLQDKISHTAFPLHLAFLSVTAVVVLAQNRFLRRIPQPDVADQAFAEYAKDLAVREDSSLRIFGLYSAALQLVVGAGVAVISIFWSNPNAFELIPLLVLAAVWVPIWLSAKYWADQVSKNEDNLKLVTQVSSGVVYVSLSLAAAAGSAAMVSRGSNLWISGILATALMVILLFAAKFARRLEPSANVVTAGLWAGAVAWLEWLVLTRGTLVELAPAALFVVLFGLLLSVADLQLGINRNRWIAPIVNGIGLAIYALEIKNHNSPEYGSLGFALAAVALMLASNLHLPIRWFVAKKLGASVNSLTKWLTFGISAFILICLQTPMGAAANQDSHSAQLTLSFTFMAYAILAQSLALWGPLKKNLADLLMANNYLGQWVTVFGILLSVGSTNPQTISTNAMLIGCLAVINYAFGTFNRSTVKMQLGFAAAITSFLVYQWSIEDLLRASDPSGAAASFGFAWKFALQLAVVAATTWLHTWFLRKRAGASEATLVATPIVATGAALIAGVPALGVSMTHDGFNGLLSALIILSVAALAAVALSRFGGLAKVPTRATALGWVGVEYASLGVLSNLVISSDQDFAGVHLRWILSTVVLAAVIQLKNVQLRSPILTLTFYLTNLATAWGAAQVTADALNWGTAPEPYTVWFAGALVVSTLLAGKNLGSVRRVLLIDVPLLGTAAISALWAFDPAANLEVSTWRGIIAWSAVSVYAYLRSKTAAPAIWVAVGYLAGAGSAWWLGSGISRWFVPSFEGPEIYSVLVTASVLIGHRVLVLRFKTTLDDLRYSLTAGVLVLPSLIYSLGFNATALENQWRQVLGTAVIAALAYWRINKSKALPWSLVAYLAALGTAVALGGMISSHLVKNFDGPEIFSILATLAVLATHRVALPKLKLKGTLFSWGLPIAVALVPSTLYTYTSLNTPFQSLDAGQITRVIVVLLVSAGLLIQGARFGNLANASMGIVGLALLVIPNTAMHSDNVVPGSRVESTSLIIGSLLFVTLWLLGRYRKLAGNSLLFIGLPIVIALAPALVRSLIALGNPTLTTVDWWRFGIVLVASMTLLIVGTLRQVAGMFYPGLVSVLLSALPYGFRQTGRDQWFLWVLLLLVAGIMVWLAVHLEKMKKAGRTSAVWLKELK